VDLAKAYLTSLKKFEPLTKQEERKLFIEYYESHNPKIKKEIIERNLRFVVWFIRKNNIKIDGMDFMDLVQEGNYVLMKAFEKFDIDQNTKFITFLGECLKGYFKNCKGIIFGRPLIIREEYNMSYYEATRDILNDLNIPIIMDCDIGHLAPQIPIVNGAILDVKSENGKGSIKNIFK